MNNYLKLTVAAALAAMVSFAAPAFAAAAQSAPSHISTVSIENLDAKAAVVIDAATGTVLFGKNPDMVIPPASLTKIVTLHLVYNEIYAGRLKKDELVTIDPRDCTPEIPYGSSIMYLRPGMKVSVLDLMQGAAVVSGNDAAFALARRIAGSNEAFALRMNEAVRSLGFSHMHFVEPSGLSELNTVTAREYAEFARLYLQLHPESIAELHSLHYIQFPRPEHATPEFPVVGRYIQHNRNEMILHYPGCDGLKTGYIIEAGYNLAATAKRGSTRFIIVTLGGYGKTIRGGGAAARMHDGTALMDWAFANFATTIPKIEAFPELRAWYSKQGSVALLPADTLAVTTPVSEGPLVKARVVLPSSLTVKADLPAGSRVGEVIYSAGDKVLRRVDIVTSADLSRANVFIVIKDAISRFFMRLAGKAAAY